MEHARATLYEGQLTFHQMDLDRDQTNAPPLGKEAEPNTPTCWQEDGALHLLLIYHYVPTHTSPCTFLLLCFLLLNLADDIRARSCSFSSVTPQWLLAGFYHELPVQQANESSTLDPSSTK